MGRQLWDRLRRVKPVTWVFLVWALMVSGLAYYSSGSGEQTIPEQVSMARTLRSADQVLADLLAKVDLTQNLVISSGYDKQGDSCRVTEARSGTRLLLKLTIYLPAGGEAQLLQTIGRGLPGRYQAHVSTIDGKKYLSAMDRSYIGIQGRVPGTGQVAISIDTGCRPGPVPSLTPAPVAQTGAPSETAAAVVSALRRLGQDANGGAPGELTAVSVPCPSGTKLWTVRAKLPGQLSPAAGLPTSGEATLLLTEPQVVVYRTGATGVVIQQSDTETDVVATSGCPS